jgi:hypothetical protein
MYHLSSTCHFWYLLLRQQHLPFEFLNSRLFLSTAGVDVLYQLHVHAHLHDPDCGAHAARGVHVVRNLAVVRAMSGLFAF